MMLVNVPGVAAGSLTEVITGRVIVSPLNAHG